MLRQLLLALSIAWALLGLFGLGLCFQQASAQMTAEVSASAVGEWASSQFRAEVSAVGLVAALLWAPSVLLCTATAWLLNRSAAAWGLACVVFPPAMAVLALSGRREAPVL